MAIEGGLMYGEHEFEGKEFTAGEVGERLAVAGVTGFVAGATGVGVVNMANRAVKLARLVRAATKAQKVARALIRIAGQSGAGAAASGITDAGRQLNTTGTINAGQLGDSMKAGAIVGGALGTAEQAIAGGAQSAGATTAAAQMSNINNTAGRFTLGASTIAGAVPDVAAAAKGPCSPPQSGCSK